MAAVVVTLDAPVVPSTVPGRNGMRVLCAITPKPSKYAFMDALHWLIFATAVFLSSYIQAIVGFGMGMVLMALAGAIGAISVPELTAAVSLISLANIVISLRGHLGAIDRRRLGWLVLGQIPAIVVGVWIMTALDHSQQSLLRLLLGLFVMFGSLSMVIRPASRPHVAPRWAWISAGIGGGLIGGMFSASGPIIGWFVYLQPLSIAAIRATMLAFFGIATFTRTIVVASQGRLDGIRVPIDGRGHRTGGGRRVARQQLQAVAFRRRAKTRRIQPDLSRRPVYRHRRVVRGTLDSAAHQLARFAGSAIRA